MEISFIGAGKMASALIRGLIQAKICEPQEITATSKPLADAEKLAKELGICAAETNARAAGAASVVILCVKPADAAEAIAACGEALAGSLLISIVAGWTTEKLSAAAPQARVIRTMPNTAAFVGKSATAIARGSTATDADQKISEDIFSAVGKVFPVGENSLNAVTGLSGSGPAFIYLVMEALSDGGVEAGLPRPLAQQLAIETMAGAVEMASSTGEHPAILREMVTSPGGTTIAGLAELEKTAVRAAFARAVCSATNRARELAE